MKFSNANSFKDKIKNIAKQKGVSTQQIQQIYLIEQILIAISNSKYKNSFIVKGGYLISSIIGIDKRTTMDLDVTLKNIDLSKENLINIFNEILMRKTENFKFEVNSILPIRDNDEYGGFRIKINATYETLQEVVFIDITTGDKITPHEIKTSMKSIFSENRIVILSYNLETVLAEKLETVISRGEGSTRPRDRYDLFTIWNLYCEDINIPVLKKAINNTFEKRKNMEFLKEWNHQVESIQSSTYQRMLWSNYQNKFKYAYDISFEESVDIIKLIMDKIGLK